MLEKRVENSRPFISGSDFKEETDLRIHVTGVANPTPIKSLLNHFSVMGRIKDIYQISKRNVGQLNRAIFQDSEKSSEELFVRSGSCVIEVWDSTTKEVILTQQPHFFEGRFLRCSSFKTDEQIMQETITKRFKKVILKKVPSSIPEEDLRLFLESSFGPIETMFSFMPDKRKLKRLNNLPIRSIKTYSVLFKQIEAAEKASMTPTLEYPSVGKFYIERYSEEVKKEKSLANIAIAETGKDAFYYVTDDRFITTTSRDYSKYVSKSLDPICIRSYTPLIPLKQSQSNRNNSQVRIDIKANSNQPLIDRDQNNGNQLSQIKVLEDFRNCASDSTNDANFNLQKIRPSPHLEKIHEISVNLKAHRLHPKSQQ